MSASPARLTQPAFARAVPKAYAALLALNTEINALGLEPEIVELIRIRASQFNGCAYCVQHHLKDARRLGVPDHKLDLLVAWQEAGLFSAREQAALIWAEALTDRPGPGATDDVYWTVGAVFGETEIAALTMVIGTIGQLNRIAASMRFAVTVPATA